ncbi:MAG: hypothetical protein M0030_17650, partial [Actinomycetota bacterium]|nr:hypothetical protein [Actinomycetota bacterium]
LEVLAEGLAGESLAAGPGHGQPGHGQPDREATIGVTVDGTDGPFDPAGWEVLTRGAWRRPGEVLLRNVCSSGLDLAISTRSPRLLVSARWRPGPTGRAVSAALRSRARLLIRAVLLQYPALWLAEQRGRTVVHASACTLGGPGGRTMLLAGPGGVGKSTLVDAELAGGGLSTADNLCVTDGRVVWGVLEPRRISAGHVAGPSAGRRMPHGRREAPWPSRPPRQEPDVVVVLRRGTGAEPSIENCPPDEAARALTAGTYMAGELRRYWAFAATVGLGTGAGEVQPRVGEVAARLCSRLPCVRVTLARDPGTDLRSLLSAFIGLEVRT